MQAKPEHLSAAHADQFSEASVAHAYASRPPYPQEVFDIVAARAVPGDGEVLELGCGTGDLTFGLATRFERLVAVDPAGSMLAVARRRAEASQRNIRWVEASAETFEYGGSYSLVVAAESLHWMDWARVLPAIDAALAPGAELIIVTERAFGPFAWQSQLGPLIARSSTNQRYHPYDLIEELSRRGLFREQGRRVTAPIEFAQSIADYVESFHSRNGFSRERMGTTRAAAFDAALTALVSPACPDGMVRAPLRATVVWGAPGQR